MTTPSVTVVGSANMDLVATVDAVPGPGETVTGTATLVVPGGKGANQAIAAARAGGQVRMVGAVGEDDFGRAIRDVLADAGVADDGLATVAETTGTAHVWVEAGGENRIVVVPGANGARTSLDDAQRDAVTSADYVLLQLEVPMALVADTVAAAAAVQDGPTVVLTPAPVQELSDDLLAGVDVLVPNEHEAARLTGEDDPVAAARELRRRGVDAVVVTLGARGCVLVDADDHGEERIVHVDSMPVEAVDTTAAGDTFVGALATALGEGREPAEALRWATAAAALSVTVPGAASSMPHRSDIDAFLVARGPGAA